MARLGICLYNAELCIIYAFVGHKKVRVKMYTVWL